MIINLDSLCQSKTFNPFTADWKKTTRKVNENVQKNGGKSQKTSTNGKNIERRKKKM